MVLVKLSIISFYRKDLESDCEMLWIELVTSKGKVNFVTFSKFLCKWFATAYVFNFSCKISISTDFVWWFQCSWDPNSIFDKYPGC